MKTLLTVLTVWAISIAIANAQSFTITDVQVSSTGAVDKPGYKEIVIDKYIGKPITLTVYDRIASVNINGKRPVNLILAKDGTYSTSMPRDEANTMLFHLEVNKLAAYIRSIVLIETIKENDSPYRTYTVKFTAKRN